VRHFEKGIPVKEHHEFSPPEKGKAQLARVYRFNEKGQHQGEQKTYYPSGVVQGVAQFDQGEPHGLKANWDEQGNLTEEMTYNQGKLQGRFFQKLQDGKELILHYQNNRRHGVHEIYYPTHEVFGKKKAFEVNFVDDVPQGEAIEYDEAGNKISSSMYVDGLKEGLVQVFHPKGETALKLIFKKDKKEGPSQEFFPDGKLAKEVTYKEDLKEGLETTYFPDGKIASKAFYVHGKLHGLSQRWNEEGVLVFEAEYKEGLRHGKFNKYFNDGKPQSFQTYVNDQIHGVKKAFDEKGICTETKWENGKKLG
jgi:antitoxin component YwqK of YwqJK toxin-antitoxin module